MSIVIPQRLSIKTKAKTKPDSKGLTEEDGGEFDAKIANAKTTIVLKDSQIKQIADTKIDAKVDIKKPIADIGEQKVKNKSAQEEQTVTHNVLAKQIVSQNQTKQDLGNQKEKLTFREVASKAQSLAKLLEDASKNKKLGLQSANIEIELSPKVPKEPQIKTMQKEKDLSKLPQDASKNRFHSTKTAEAIAEISHKTEIIEDKALKTKEAKDEKKLGAIKEKPIAQESVVAPKEAKAEKLVATSKESVVAPKEAKAEKPSIEKFAISPKEAKDEKKLGAAKEKPIVQESVTAPKETKAEKPSIEKFAISPKEIKPIQESVVSPKETKDEKKLGAAKEKPIVQESVTAEAKAPIIEKPTLGDLLKLTEPKVQNIKKDKKQIDKAVEEDAKQDTKSLNSKLADTPTKEAIKGEQHIVIDEKQGKNENKKESNQNSKSQDQTLAQPALLTGAQTTEELSAKMAQTTQTIKYFSEDLKEQIDNYRPPLVKLSLNLNPADLGAVNVTMIARGGALNVSMTSSQSTLQMIMQNSGQLQQNLTALGFTNLAINFNSSDKKSGDKKSDTNGERKEDGQKRYKEATGKKDLLIDSIDLKIFDTKYI